MRLPQHSASEMLPTMTMARDMRWAYGGVRLSGGGNPPPPPPGCWFAGTQCRVGVQSCKFCCGDGKEVTQLCGWCIGWWDYPPCVG
jgi:hypothetical protein